MPPSIIDHHYQVLRLLGEGMSAQVYEVKKGDQNWALKLLKTKVNTSSEEWLAAFKFEFSLLKDISNPHVVRIGDYGFDATLKRPYFTEELLTGLPLDIFAGRHPQAAWLDLFAQAIDGLEAIHGCGVLHGDLKPGNIIVTGSEQAPVIKIFDLGIADPELNPHAGTPATMAPEKILKEPSDARSDLYSLAASFYSCLSGANPFVKNGVSETLNAQLTLNPPAIGAVRSDVDPLLNRLISNLLAKNPHERLKNCREVVRELGKTREDVLSLLTPTDRWIGRAEALKAAEKWATGLKSFSVFLVTGEEGTGKSRFLEEWRYRLQLAGISVGRFTEGLDEAAPCRIYLADELPDAEALDRAGLPQKALGLAVAADEKNAKRLQAFFKARRIPLSTCRLTAFDRDEIRTFLKFTARTETIPDDLIEKLFSTTGGNPQKVFTVVSHLCRKENLLATHGELNLGIFREMDLSEIITADGVPDEKDLTDLPPAERLTAALGLWEKALRVGDVGKAFRLEEFCATALGNLAAGQQRLAMRASFLEKKGWSQILQNRFEEALSDLRTAQNLLEEMSQNPSDLLLRLQNFEAYVLLRTGQASEALALYEKTHTAWKELGSYEKSRVPNNDLGMALLGNGEADKAVVIFKEDLLYYETLENPSPATRCHYNLGECLLKLQRYGEALNHYREAALRAKKHRLYDLLLRAYNGLGNAYNLLKKPESSLDYYQRALELAVYRRDYASAAAIAQNMGVIEGETGDYDKALRSLSTSLTHIDQSGKLTPHLSYLKARAFLERGNIRRHQGQWEQARADLDIARHLVSQKDGPTTLTFWVICALAELKLDEKNHEGFVALYPELIHLAQTDEDKKYVEFLRKRSPIDPLSARVTGEEKNLPPTPAPAATHLSQATIVFDSAMNPNPVVSGLKSVLAINSFLNSERDLQTLLELILKHALLLSGAENGLILLLEPDGSLNVAAALNITVDKSLSQISTQVAREALASAKPVRADNAQEDARFKQSESVMLLGLKSIFCVPIRSQQKMVGVLYLTHRFQTGLFSKEQEEILMAFADQTGLAIENARLFGYWKEQNEKLKEKLDLAGEKIADFEKQIKSRSTAWRSPYPYLMAQSASMQKLTEMIERVGPTQLSVLVRGESGTGKELIAKALHEKSGRSGPFVAINCGALPANLIESELFGYKAGAFTGAARDKKGLFEEADGGTLFLDEIGDMDPALQVKLLRALQEKEITRVGDTRPQKVDVRVISATLKDLEAALKNNQFRQDLYYRLAEVSLHILPLRDRPEDIPLLLEHFAGEFAKEQKLKTPPKLARELVAAFTGAPWPGNVRELRNRIRLALALSDRKEVTLNDLPEGERNFLNRHDPSTALASPPPLLQDAKKLEDFLSSGITWMNLETLVMAQALIQTAFDIPKAAQNLKIGQATLYNRVRTERLKEKKEEYKDHPPLRDGGESLDDFKKRVFSLAFMLCGEKPYQAAKALGVSPGTFYKWCPQGK